MAKSLLSELSEVIKQLPPPGPPQPKSGRPRVSNRVALAGTILSGTALLLCIWYGTLVTSGRLIMVSLTTKATEMTAMQDQNPQVAIETLIMRALRNMEKLQRVQFASTTVISFSDGRSSVVMAQGDYVANEGMFTRRSQDGQTIETLSIKNADYVRQGGAWAKVSLPPEWTSRIAQSAKRSDPSEVSVPAWGPVRVQDFIFSVERDVPSNETEFDVFVGVPSGPDSITALTNSILRLWIDKQTANIVKLQKNYDFGPPINKTSVTTTTFSRFNDPDLVLPTP